MSQSFPGGYEVNEKPQSGYRSTREDLNPGHPERDADVLTTWP